MFRKITLDDKEDLFKLHSHPDVQIYTGEPVVESIEEIEKAIRVRIEDYQKYGFDSLQIRKIIALKENEASIRVMEKVGMKFDKLAPYESGSEDAV